MQWLQTLASALLALLKEPLTQLAAFLAGRRQGQIERERDYAVEQRRKDVETLDKASRADNELARGGLRDTARKYHTDE